MKIKFIIAALPFVFAAAACNNSGSTTTTTDSATASWSVQVTTLRMQRKMLRKT